MEQDEDLMASKGPGEHMHIAMQGLGHMSIKAALRPTKADIVVNFHFSL